MTCTIVHCMPFMSLRLLYINSLLLIPMVIRCSVQGVAEIRAFSVAALQLSHFANRFSQDPLLAEMVPDLPDASAARPPSSASLCSVPSLK